MPNKTSRKKQPRFTPREYLAMKNLLCKELGQTADLHRKELLGHINYKLSVALGQIK